MTGMTGSWSGRCRVGPAAGTAVDLVCLVWVYDFVATPADVPADSALAGKHAEHATPQIPEQIVAGRLAGAQVAEQLVE